MEPIPAVDLDLLLREEAWLRAFARRLVAADDADDLVQQTWLAALLRPVALRDARAWLATLAANLSRMLHRGQVRRRARERGRAAAQAPSEPSTADTVARLEVQQLVAAAICALPEPTRSIVVLRYHDGLQAEAIAARLRISATTVRKRLQRGRDAVRAALARELGPDWRSLAFVLAFAELPHEAPRRLPRANPSTMAVAAAAVTVVAISIGCIATGAAPSTVAPPPAATSAIADIAHNDRHEGDRSAAADAESRAPDSRIAVEAGASGQEQARGDPAFVGVRLRGRCLAAETRAPLAGVQVEATCALPLGHPLREAVPRHERVVTGEDGRFAFALPIPAGRVDLWLRATERVTRHDGLDAPRKETTDLGDVVMQHGFKLRGRVLDPQSRPVPGVVLHVPVAVGITSAARITFPIRSDAAGHFECPELVSPGTIELQLQSPRNLRLVTGAIEMGPRTEAAGIDLRVESLPGISGVVFDAQGKPVAEVMVIAGARMMFQGRQLPGLVPFADATTSADGSFELCRRPEDPDEFLLQVGDIGSPFEPTVGPEPVHWDAHGLRLTAVAAAPVVITVLGEGDRPVEQFEVRQSWLQDIQATTTSTESLLKWHANGSFVANCVHRGTNVLDVIPKDPRSTTAELRIEGSALPDAPVTARVESLQPLPVLIVDGDDKPIDDVAVDLLDMRGTTDPDWFDDWRTGRSTTGKPAALRIATGRTGADGKAALAAPRSRRDLLLVVRSKPPFTQVLTALPEDGKPLRVVAPRSTSR